MSKGRGLRYVLGIAAVTWWLAAPAADAKQFGYLSGFTTGHIAGGELVPADGGFQDLPGSPYVTGSDQLQGIAVAPGGREVFVADESEGDLRAFTVAKNGSLQAADGSPQPVGSSPYGVAPTPNGKYVYVAADDGTVVAGFKIAGDGGIEPTGQGTVTNGHGPRGVAIDAKGEHLFTANGDGTVSSYAIAANGKLSEVSGSPFGAVDSPYAVVVAPNGKTVYVANRDSPSAVHAFAVDPDGSLTELLGSPWTTGGNNAFSLAISPDGENVYAGNYASNSLAAFGVEADGALAPLAGSPYPSTESPAAVTFDASGSYLFLNGGSGPLQTWQLAADGLPVNPLLNIFGQLGDFQSIALTPAQPPRAKLKAKRKKMKVKLNASKSKDDGRIVEYRWKFGDGSTATTMGPKVTHAYDKRGKYEVSVTLTDDDRCSTKYVAGGQTAYCNGSKQARKTKKVKIK